MKVRKLHENNELSDRAAKHKKKSKGLSPFCTLNTDAGNVEHNVAMFNQLNTPDDSPSVDPCGPMAESFDEPLQEQANDTVELHYDDLEVEVCVKPRSASGYGFDYDRDEAQYETDYVSHDYSAPLSEVVNIIAENLDDEEFGGSVYDATDEEVNKFILDNFDRLFSKYERTILAAFEDNAKEDALRYMNESCGSNLKESSNEYIIMAVNHDGSKKYYNVSSAPHWVDNGKDATIFDNMDEARSVWFDLNKKPFKRVFIPNYDPQIMNEALTPVDFDKMYAIDLLRDKTSWMMDEVVGKEYQVIPHWSDGYKVNTKTGRPILQVQFDSHDPNAGFVFSIDGGSEHRVQTDTEAAKIIMDTARRKYVNSFDVAVESLEEDWTPPADWVSYKGAWIYPVDGGYEANFTGEHFEAPTIDELKIKLMNARMHRQHFSGYSERDAKFADNIKKFGRELSEDYHEATKDAILDWLEEHDQAHEDAQRFFQDMPLSDVDREDLISWIEDHKQLFDDFKRFFNKVDEGLLDRHYDESKWEPEDIEIHKNTDWKARNYEELPIPEDSFEHEVVAYGLPGGTQRKKVKFIKYIRPNEVFPPYYAPEEDAFENTVGCMYDGAKRGKYDIHNRYDTQEVYDALSESTNESWSPDMIDCPACGDVSFDSKKGRCARCSYTESANEKPLYIIKDSHGNQLSAPNPSDDELWDRVASMEARGRRGLCVVAYTSADKNSLKEWNEFSDDDFEDDQMHANVYGGDSNYCSDCGAVKTYDEDGFSFCPECNAQSYIQEARKPKKMRKPKYWDTMFRVRVTTAYESGKLTYDNIKEWDTAYNGGIAPIPPFNTKEILDYYLATKDSEQEELTEASYGGAYDIADDQYFTREDLVSCAEKVIEHLNETFDDTFQIADVRLEGPNMILEVDGEELGWYMEKCKIDMRRIRVPSNLTDRYALELASQLIAQIKCYNDL